MKDNFIRTFLLFLFLGGIFNLAAQKSPAKIWATASFNKKEVMVGEPLVVTVTVYTSTWFTKPPVFEEIQVKGALMTRLEQRNSARTVTIGRKQYPAIEQKFVVYPNAIGKNTLPPFKVTITSPPEGDYKGKERTIYTKEQSFEVLAPPEGVDSSIWLASYKVSLSDVWDRPLDRLKAGDLLERRISIKASGALAAAIPPLPIPKVDFGTIYPKTPSLSNYQNRASFSGTRTEIYNYLLEKDGSYELPEIIVPWYNLKLKKIEYEKLPAIKIEVASNEDLAFILTRQKELQEALAKEQEQKVETPEEFRLFGLNWWQLILILLSVISLLKLFIEGINRIKILNRNRQEKKLLSEKYYLELLENACEKGDVNGVITQLFHWYDHYRENRFGPEFHSFIKESENETFEQEINHMAERVYSNDSADLSEVRLTPDFINSIKKTRQKNMNKEDIGTKGQWSNINPK